MNSRHPDPRRVLGRCRAAVRGQDPLDPRDPLGSRGSGDGIICARFRHNKNDENETPISKLSILLCFVLVFVIDFSFSLCFTMISDAFLLKSCSKAAPAALGGCGGLGQLWEALAELWEALESSGRLYI